MITISVQAYPKNSHKIQDVFDDAKKTFADIKTITENDNYYFVIGTKDISISS